MTHNDLPTSAIDATSATVGSTELPTDDYHRLMAAGERRATLAVLSNLTPPVDLEDLAVTVVDSERGPSPTGPDASSTVAVALHHEHLPLMDEMDVLDYDPDANRVDRWRSPEPR